MTGPDIVPDLTCDEVRELAGTFVLGALEPADEAAVRAHLVACDDPHAEIAELGGVLPALALSVPMVEPPAGLKARILAAAAADLANRGEEDGTAALAAEGQSVVAPIAAVAPAAAVPAAPVMAPPPVGPPAVAPTPFPTASERTARRERATAGAWALRIAAVLVIVVLGGWNLLLQAQLNTAHTYEQSVATVLDVASQPGSHTAILTTTAGGTGSGLAAISAAGEVTIAMQDLAPTSGQTVYTAWAIGGNGVPISLGDFTVGSSGTATLEGTGAPSANGVVLALTLEPGPGATAPSGPIVSKGVATSAG